jgi:hypothetical protein
MDMGLMIKGVTKMKGYKLEGLLVLGFVCFRGKLLELQRGIRIIMFIR